jgi:thioredoxin-related protein
MKMKTRFFLFLLFVTGFWFSGQSFARDLVGKDPKFNRSYNQALNKAAQQNKPAIIIFSASWCGPCQKMKKEVYPSKAVQPLHDKFIWAYLDIDESTNQKFVKKYDVRSYPTILILDAQEKIIDRSGSASPEDFASFLDEVLEKVKK